MNRTDSLNRIRDRRERWDIIVIGGGATGVGCALDAASRGYDVLLVEQHDFGKGTSSRSTKLIHGGVRYLAQGNISLVREGLRERAILLRNAPHVVYRQEFIIPCYGGWQKAKYGFGLKLYDWLAGKFSIGKSRILSRGEVIESLPGVRTNGLTGGVLYYDAQFDDTRLLIDMARTADIQGACLLNYSPVTSLMLEGDKVKGVVFTDAETGDTYTVEAKSVINATGIFCDELRRMSDPAAKPVVTFAQGSHLVLDRRFLPSQAALLIPKTSDGRVLFCIPWKEHVLIGTTDTPVDQSAIEPEAFDSEIDFILETAGEHLATKPARDDIKSVFAGIRPLISRTNAKNTSALSRGHEMFADKSGLITITGGKWTTYRRMAEDAVNQAATIGGIKAVPCVTATLRIEGTFDQANTEILHPALRCMSGDVVRAARVEMARTVEDVLARRTRALFLNARAAIEMAPKVAQILAAELGKSKEWTKAQLGNFGELADRYLAKPHSDKLKTEN